jgi:2-oxoglutarate ferredoxin oxidoreductase subunit delta
LTAPHGRVYAEVVMGKTAGRGTVFITREWCKGCRICVHLCPEGVLGLDLEEKAVVVRAAACTACLFCELHCPDLAIEVQVEAGSRGRAPKMEKKSAEGSG